MPRLDEDYEAVTVRDGDDIGSNRSTNRPLLELVEARLSRRAALKGFVTTAAFGALGGTLTSRIALAAAGDPSTLTFGSLAQVIKEDHHVAPGYDARVLIRWGDPVLADAPAFDPRTRRRPPGEAVRLQQRLSRLSTRCRRLDRRGDRCLLVVNHEYTNPELMFPGLGSRPKQPTRPAEQAEVEMAAHRRRGGRDRASEQDGDWKVVAGQQATPAASRANTPMEISGPAAGHDRLKTIADPAGRKVLGTFNNCAGGSTPWGTVADLRGELQRLLRRRRCRQPCPRPKLTSATALGRRPPMPGHATSTASTSPRSRTSPTASAGWSRSIPTIPASMPVKRTALGRFKHEGCT